MIGFESTARVAPPNGKGNEPANDTAEPAKLPFVWVRDFGELMKPPKLRWLFSDRRTGRPFMRAGKCYALAANGGVGKGFVTLQTAASIVTGMDLFGTFQPEQSGRVALLVAEDDQDEVHHRLYRIVNALGITDIEAIRQKIGIFPLSGEQVNLLSVDRDQNPQRTPAFQALIHQLTEIANDGGFEWSLISFDPLARFGAANVEIDQASATAFVAALEHLGESLPGKPATSVAAHSSAASVKEGRSNMRGVTGLRNAFRLVMTLDAFHAEGVDGVLLRTDKSNLSCVAPPLWLVRKQNEQMGDGRYIEMAGALCPATEEEIAKLESVAGSTVAASREQREQAKTTARKSKFEAECDVVVECLPEAPEFKSQTQLLAALAAAGRSCSHHTLAPRIAALLETGRVVDLSDGTKASQRQYARAAQ